MLDIGGFFLESAIGSSMSCLRSLLVCCLALFCTATAAHASTPSVGTWQTKTVMSDVANATGAAVDRAGDLFVAAQAGMIYAKYVGRPKGRILDWRDRINFAIERGLSDIAVTPASTWKRTVLFAYYAYDPPGAPKDDTGARTIRLSKLLFKKGKLVSSTTILGSTVKGCSQFAVLRDCLSSDGPMHSSGTVQLAQDGTLWTGSGDGEIGQLKYQVARRAQMSKYSNGKIFHIDQNGRGLPDHPFCPGASLRDTCAKIFAMGFRNPWRFALDTTAAADGGQQLIVGDVGQESWEELDLVNKGYNGGWACVEAGISAFWAALPECTANASSLQPPTYAYPHIDGGNAVIGGPRLPAAWSGVSGYILFGDFTQETLSLYNPIDGTVQAFWPGMHITKIFVLGNQLYLVDWGSGEHADGRLLRLTPRV